MSQYRADIAICGALRVLGCVTTADVSRYPPYIATSDARRDSTARPPHNGTHTAPRRDVRHVATRSRHVLSPYRDSPPPSPGSHHGPPRPFSHPLPLSRYPAPLSRHSRPEPLSWPGSPHPEVPRPRAPPTRKCRSPLPAAPFPPARPRSCLSAAHVTAGAASRRHRAARARERGRAGSRGRRRRHVEGGGGRVTRAVRTAPPSAAANQSAGGGAWRGGRGLSRGAGLPLPSYSTRSH